MSALARKGIRDVWHLRGQILSVAAVVACGIASMVTMRGMHDSLLASREAYYAEDRFADVFVHLRRAPDPLIAKFRAIPGVAQAETRVVTQVLVDVPGLNEPASGHLVSVPERGRPLLNDVHLRSGRWVAPGRGDEIMVSEAFAQANHLQVGNALGALVNGRWREFRIVGIGLSPEFVYEVPAGAIFPDKRRFGVFWLNRAELGPALNMDGAFNDATFSLMPGADTAEVIARVDALLESYGGLGAFDREDQISHRFLSDEIRQHAVSGVVIGYIFLGVAAFLLNVVLARLVGMQRDQLAVLKAFGYRNHRIAYHYLAIGLVPVILGSVAGCALGAWSGAKVADVFAQFYRFPVLRHVITLRVLVTAVLVSVISAVIGTMGATRRAFRLPPAEAMRPEAPPAARRGLLDRLGLLAQAGPALRMVARSLARRPVRAGLSMIGIAVAVALLLVGRYFFDAVDYMANVSFRLAQRQDATVTFTEPRGARARFELGSVPGVLGVEPFRSVPARIHHGQYLYRIGLQGLPEDGTLRRLLDASLTRVAVPDGGVLLTQKLGEILHVRPGDTLTVEILEGRRPVRTVVVAGLVDELIGLGAYLRLPALNALMEEGPTISGALLSVDEAREAALYQRLKALPAVAGVSSRAATLESFNETLAGSMRISTRITLTFACIIAIAVIYNGMRVTLSERARELASLRVLGFTRGEVALVLFGEQGILTLVALPIGSAMGYLLCSLITRAYDTDTYRLPLVLSGRSFLFACGVVVVAALATTLLVRRRVNRLDLVGVLKTRE
ncbi:MAG: FtsX-like permease family protein [Gemmatimonadales bacterium]